MPASPDPTTAAAEPPGARRRSANEGTAPGQSDLANMVQPAPATCQRCRARICGAVESRNRMRTAMFIAAKHSLCQKLPDTSGLAARPRP
jgi:hypothetical protein